MRSLSRRLEPVRVEFGLRLYHWSLRVLEQQVCDDSSLFWRVPSRVIRNLHQLFSGDEDDPLRFFLIRHACRYQGALMHLGQPIPSDEGMSQLLRRCIDPSGSDVSRRGLLPLSTAVPRLNRRTLHAALGARLVPVFEEKTDQSDRGEWLFEARTGPWIFVARYSTSISLFQIDLEFDVVLGMGDLSLSRQLSLHRLFGIGPSAWDLARPGEEEATAALINEHSRFMLTSLSTLLEDLDPSITKEEVLQAENEWRQWLAESRAQRAHRTSRR
jgi:hypothetical protein